MKKREKWGNISASLDSQNAREKDTKPFPASDSWDNAWKSMEKNSKAKRKTTKCREPLTQRLNPPGAQASYHFLSITADQILWQLPIFPISVTVLCGVISRHSSNVGELFLHIIGFIQSYYWILAWVQSYFMAATFTPPGTSDPIMTFFFAHNDVNM